jgi:NAD(P)-dependent dehydrogenase (short-subunit alcohol dehydrogenase family)
MDNTIVAIITGVLSLIGTLCGSYFAHRKSTVLIAYRLSELEEKVDKHNNLVERMVAVEKDVKSAHHRINELAGRVSK